MIKELLPWLYLKGISTGDFFDALATLAGPDAPGLSASPIMLLKADWRDDDQRWPKRDLSARAFGSGPMVPASARTWTWIANVCW